ncbi:glycosyltransferase family 4 protein [Brevibacillus marinus]|uniref:glycosyltransferase family 4 protein n=1 Tax=Brevibacillus marinus TaxID=2496837 RepID=UPI000F83DA56|nr:glycosyltransferase family 4 protein [Brevibacillus marinus]
MKILIATFWQMPHVGGVNRYLNLLSKELEERGHQVDLLAHYPDMQKIYLQRYRKKDEFSWTLSGQAVLKKKLMDRIFPEVYAYYQQNLPHVEPWIRWREIERYLFELIASLFDLHQYDLIHTHDLLATRALWRVKPAHVPLVYKVHGLVASVHVFNGEIKHKEELKWKYVAAEEYAAAMSCDALIVPSRWLMRDLTEEFKVPRERFRIIPYGLDIAPFLEQYGYEPYPPVNVSPNKLVIACPARLSAEKGQKTLIEAVARLKEQRSDFVCWLIGDGVQRSELENYCQVLGVADRVVFLGDRSDVPALLRKAEIMVLPSLEDNQPHAIMEAQIAGKAIVASDGGGIPEMIRHGETGLIFAKRNSEQLAAQLQLLLDNPELRSRLAANAREWGRKQWSSQVLCERTLEVYQATVAAKKEQTKDPLGEPELTGQYGLSKPPGIKRDEPASMFRFAAMNSFREREWRELANRLPQTYAIPDPFFVRTLAEG